MTPVDHTGKDGLMDITLMKMKGKLSELFASQSITVVLVHTKQPQRSEIVGITLFTNYMEYLTAT